MLAFLSATIQFLSLASFNAMILFKTLTLSLGNVSRVGKFAGQSDALCKLGGMQPSLKQIS